MELIPHVTACILILLWPRPCLCRVIVQFITLIDLYSMYLLCVLSEKQFQIYLTRYIIMKFKKTYQV